MARDTVATVVGNLTGDPELRFTQSGRPVASFSVASTPRSFDKESGEWRDGETLFLNCSVWGRYAENVAASLHRGAAVVVTGRLVAREYVAADGTNRRVIDMQVDEVGPTLRFATAVVTKTTAPGAPARLEAV